MLATDLADYLVAKKVPFREAHGIMRRVCEHCETEGKELQALTMQEYQRFSPHFGPDVYQITAESSVAARDNPGGTAPQQVASIWLSPANRVTRSLSRSRLPSIP